MPIARSNKGMEDLARRMSASEETTFLEFSRVFGPRIKAFFASRGLASADAEDLSVSCVTDISLRIDKYTSLREGGFVAWVFTIAHHRLMDWFRQRLPTELFSESLDSLESLAETDNLEPNWAMVQAVREALDSLSERDRMVISLRDLNGEYAYSAIGEHLGITTEASRVCHHRAVKKLKEILERDPRITGWLNQNARWGK